MRLTIDMKRIWKGEIILSNIPVDRTTGETVVPRVQVPWLYAGDRRDRTVGLAKRLVLLSSGVSSCYRHY